MEAKTETKSTKANIESEFLYDLFVLELIIGDMFEKCTNDAEVDWLQTQIENIAEDKAEQRLEGLI